MGMGRVEPRFWQRGTLIVVMFLLVGVGAAVMVNLYLASFPPLAATPSKRAAALELPDEPSIAVLPFINTSEDPKQEYFSNGITEAIITDLSKIPGLFVISRQSVFTYKGKDMRVKQVGQELGVRYVLEGSVRKAGDHVRMTAQLVEATTGDHLWAERYDRNLKDIFTLQDEISKQIMFALKVKLTKEEQERFWPTPTDNLEAYEYYLRGKPYFWRYTRETSAQARQMFEKAIELDPEYAEAYACLSETYWLEWIAQWGRNPLQSLQLALKLAQRAVALDDSLPVAHGLLGYIYLGKKQHKQAIVEAERAIALNPNYAEGYMRLGAILNFAGRPEESIRLVEKAMRLNPHYPASYLMTLGQAYCLTGRYEKAMAAQKKALIRNPDSIGPRFCLTACAMRLGQEKEARAQAAEILRLSPNFSLEMLRQAAPHKDPKAVEPMLENLGKAGLG